MSYNYINVKELYDMHKKNRQAIIIFDVQTKDMEEYINNCIITLKNEGFNMNLLINPRVLSNVKKGNNNKIIVIPIKNNSTLDNYNSKILGIWAEQMGNVCSIKNFFDNDYRNSNEKNKISLLAHNIDKYIYIEYNALNMKSKNNVNEGIYIKNINKYIGKPDKNNIENYIMDIVSYLFKHKNRFVYTMLLCKDKINRTAEDIVIKVEPAANSVKLTYCNQ